MSDANLIKIFKDQSENETKKLITLLNKINEKIQVLFKHKAVISFNDQLKSKIQEEYSNWKKELKSKNPDCENCMFKKYIQHDEEKDNDCFITNNWRFNSKLAPTQKRFSEWPNHYYLYYDQLKYALSNYHLYIDKTMQSSNNQNFLLIFLSHWLCTFFNDLIKFIFLLKKNSFERIIKEKLILSFPYITKKEQKKAKNFEIENWFYWKKNYLEIHYLRRFINHPYSLQDLRERTKKSLNAGIWVNQEIKDKPWVVLYDDYDFSYQMSLDDHYKTKEELSKKKLILFSSTPMVAQTYNEYNLFNILKKTFNKILKKINEFYEIQN